MTSGSQPAETGISLPREVDLSVTSTSSPETCTDKIAASKIIDISPVTTIVEVVERFTYFGSDIHVSAGCESEVNRRLGRAWGVMDSLDHGV